MQIRKSDFHPDLQHLIPTLYRQQRLAMLPGMLRLFGWWNRYSDRDRDIEGLDCATDYLKSSLDGAEIRARIYGRSTLGMDLCPACFTSMVVAT